jgi:hypothetical protein
MHQVTGKRTRNQNYTTSSQKDVLLCTHCLKIYLKNQQNWNITHEISTHYLHVYNMNQKAIDNQIFGC